ncbi:helix-turn-helix domain-containing protein [Rheinheimera sp.]|uniref:helix-turn-helix domain-containing protein n=1 Tax=Rheinheimera sp. TaxID=1869214 RepID=UPI004047578A
MNDSLGKRIKSVMDERNMNQTKFAEALNCSPGFVSDIIRNKKKPGCEFIRKVAERFNVSADWIVTGKCVNVTKGIDFEKLGVISSLTELVLAARKGDDGAIALVKNMIGDGQTSEQPKPSEELKARLKSRLDEMHFIAQIYNSTNGQSSDSIQNEALLGSIERYALFSDDPLIKLLNDTKSEDIG